MDFIIVAGARLDQAQDRQGRNGRWTAVIVPALVIGGLFWCGWRWWDVRRYRDAMARIDEAMQAGRYAAAARDLSALLARRPDSDRTAYLLGVCEKARGRPREADAAWARIDPDSPSSGRAIAGRMDLLLEQGRLGDAEDLIERATEARGSEGSALRMLLIPTLVQEGRGDEAHRLIESRWRHLQAKGEGASEQAINLARLHMELGWNVPPVDSVRAYLDQVGRLAPDDDRIWLGRANLALRAGSHEEAARWIDACLRRRPDDRSVWRARLDWALKTHRLADARDALKHLPAGSASRAEVYRLSAWFAAACGDLERHRRELAALVVEAPEDLAALDRLERREARGSVGTAAAPHRGKTEIERDQARYRALYRRNQPARDAEEMARLAERLGRRFEATVFLNAAIAEEPDRADLREALRRLEEATRRPDEAGRSLFDRLPTDCAGQGPSSGTESVP
jgi:tetratricopeptide (TPR) repeat protein